MSKVTVVLLGRQLAELDRLAVDIRLRHGVVLTRGDIIRALVEAASRAHVDLSQADSAAALMSILSSSWPAPRSV